MPTSVTCPECGARVRAEDRRGSRSLRCRRCGAVVPVRDRWRDDPDVPDEAGRQPGGNPVFVTGLAVGCCLVAGVFLVGGLLVLGYMAMKPAPPGPIAQGGPAGVAGGPDAGPAQPEPEPAGQLAGPPPAGAPQLPVFVEPPRAVGTVDFPPPPPFAPPAVGTTVLPPAAGIPRGPGIGGTMTGAGLPAFVPPPRLEPPGAPPPPPADFRLRAIESRLEITPTALTGETASITLPGPAKDVCAGGGGRFLLFLLGNPRQIAVLDLSAGKVVKFLPVADDPALMAAGMDKLVVLYPQKRVVQRWSLVTLEREKTAPLPDNGTPFRAAMGSASAGPVYVTFKQEWRGGVRGGSLRPIDLDTLKVMTATLRGNFTTGTHPDYPPDLRVSADGRTIGMWTPHLSPTGLQIVSAAEDGLTAVYEHTTAGAVLPGPDGSTVFTALGLYGRDGRPKGDRDAGVFLPAVHGPYHLRVDGIGQYKIAVRGDTKPTVRVYRTGDSRPLATLTDLPGLDAPADRFGPAPALASDQRVHFIPRAGVLVTVAAAGDKVYLRKLNPEAALEASGADYLYVRSEPVADAERGKRFEYALDVRSKKGGVKAKLESGPDGMSLVDGRLTWRVPVALAESEVRVLMSVSDAGNQEIFHTLTVRVFDAGKSPPRLSARPVAPGAAADPGFVALKSAPEPPEAVRPPALADAKARVKLPSAAADDICFGGGGRYMILRLPAERQLAVFDASAAKVVKYLPIAEADAKFAAGRTKLVVALPQAGILQRWSLETFEKEQSAPSPVVSIAAIAMGSATDGPLLIQEGAGGGPRARRPQPFRLIDPLTFKESELEVVVGKPPQASGDYQMSMPKRPLVSADGRLICGCGVYVRTAGGYQSTAAPDHSTPDPEGRYLYGPGRVCTAEGAMIGAGMFMHGAAVWNYAAAQGPYYFSINQVDVRGARSKAELRLHLAGDREPIYKHPDKDIFDPLMDWISGRGVWGTNVFCIPDAELLIVMSKARDELILSRMDWKKGAGQDGRELLYVTGAPPPAERGSTFRYLPRVRSTKGSVKARLESGPPGMKLTADGLVWDVPRGFSESSAEVMVTVADSSGQELFHTLRIEVCDSGRGPGAGKAGK